MSEKDDGNQRVAVLTERQAEVIGEMLGGRAVSIEKETRSCVSVRGEGDGGSVREMRVALQLANVTPTRLASTLRLALRAKRVITAKGIVIGSEPDWTTRLKALELAHKLRGDLVADKLTQGETVTYEQRLLQIVGKKT